MTCPHTRDEKVIAVDDGKCPICLQARIAELNQVVQNAIALLDAGREREDVSGVLRHYLALKQMLNEEEKNEAEAH